MGDRSLSRMFWQEFQIECVCLRLTSMSKCLQRTAKIFVSSTVSYGRPFKAILSPDWVPYSTAYCQPVNFLLLQLWALPHGHQSQTKGSSRIFAKDLFNFLPRRDFHMIVPRPRHEAFVLTSGSNTILEVIYIRGDSRQCFSPDGFSYDKAYSEPLSLLTSLL